LTQCSKGQYQQIAPDNQPHLAHCFLLSAPCQFYERILFGKVHLPHLISIGCPRGAFIYLLNTIHTTNRTIRQLHLQSTLPEILCKFISIKIIHLLQHYFANSHIRRLNIVHPQSSQLCLEQLLLSVGFPDLTYLRITFDTCNFPQLACILTTFLCLKHFILQVNTFPSDFTLIATRLVSSWFRSLNYGRFIDKSNHEQATLINNSKIH